MVPLGVWGSLEGGLDRGQWPEGDVRGVGRYEYDDRHSRRSQAIPRQSILLTLYP